MTAAKRIRHGVVSDPMLGYRAVCEVDGERSWVGPWTTEAQADANAAASSQAWRSAVLEHGGHYEAGSTPLGVWAPREVES